MAPGRLVVRHIHFPGPTPYLHASHLQNQLVRALLDSKASSTTHLSTTSSPPPPTILTAEFNPVYTCGRREIGSLSPDQINHLRADGRAEFHEALRGGQTTFHGPGQLVAYPILDLRRHGITPRCYIRLLENTVIKTCTDYGIEGTETTENPGVWTKEGRKICAVGVHLRRNVSSHGIGLNVGTDIWWFDRIVACGLPEKEATSFEREGVRGKTVEEVGDMFVKNLAQGMANSGETVEVDKIDQDAIPGLEKSIMS